MRESIGDEEAHFAVSSRTSRRDGRLDRRRPAVLRGQPVQGLGDAGGVPPARRGAARLRRALRRVRATTRRIGLNDGELQPCSRGHGRPGAPRHDARERQRRGEHAATTASATRTSNATLRGFGLASRASPGRRPAHDGRGHGALLEAIAPRQGGQRQRRARRCSRCWRRRPSTTGIPALLPPGTRVAHKTGNWEQRHPRCGHRLLAERDVRHRRPDRLRLRGRRQRSRIARLSKAVYDYYNPG